MRVFLPPHGMWSHLHITPASAESPPSTWPDTEEVCNIAAEKERRIECYPAGFLLTLEKNKQTLQQQLPCRFAMKAEEQRACLSFLPHILWGHSSRDIWVHQILSGERNVSADNKAGNYWNNCQLGHPYRYLLSLRELNIQQSCPIYKQVRAKDPSRNYAAGCFRDEVSDFYQINRFSHRNTFRERKWPYWRRMSGKVGIVWPLENTGDWRCYWSCHSS